MPTEVLELPLAELACGYADAVIEALYHIEDEQQLHEGLAGAFLSFYEDVVAAKEDLCQPRIGTPAA